jgi:hypothetical protein
VDGANLKEGLFLVNRKRAERLLELARSVRGPVDEMNVILDSEQLQVGDFQVIDRSLRVLAREADSLATFLVGMLSDQSRIER